MADTHPYPPLISRTRTRMHLGAHLFLALPGALALRTHTSSCLLEIHRVDDDRHTFIHIPTLDCLHKHMFLFLAYRSVSLACMQWYTQLAYLVHQCGTSLLSRDGRPFSSLKTVLQKMVLHHYLCIKWFSKKICKHILIFLFYLRQCLVRHALNNKNGEAVMILKIYFACMLIRSFGNLFIFFTRYTNI